MTLFSRKGLQQQLEELRPPCSLRMLACQAALLPCPPCAHAPQIGIKPTIPLTPAQLNDIPLAAESFCRFANTDAAPALF